MSGGFTRGVACRERCDGINVSKLHTHTTVTARDTQARETGARIECTSARLSVNYQWGPRACVWEPEQLVAPSSAVSAGLGPGPS